MTLKRKIAIAVLAVTIIICGTIFFNARPLASTPTIVVIKPYYGGSYRCLLTEDKTLEVIHYWGSYEIEEPPVDKYIEYRNVHTLTDEEFDVIIYTLEKIRKDGLRYEMAFDASYVEILYKSKHYESQFKIWGTLDQQHQNLLELMKLLDPYIEWV